MRNTWILRTPKRHKSKICSNAILYVSEPIVNSPYFLNRNNSTAFLLYLALGIYCILLVNRCYYSLLGFINININHKIRSYNFSFSSINWSTPTIKFMFGHHWVSISDFTFYKLSSDKIPPPFINALIWSIWFFFRHFCHLEYACSSTSWSFVVTFIFFYHHHHHHGVDIT